MKSKYTKKMKGGNLLSSTMGMGQNIYDSINDFFARLTSRDEADAPWRNCIIRYIIMTAIVIGVCVVSFNIINNQQSAERNVDKYFFVIAIPLVLIFAILLNIGKAYDGTESGTSSFFKISGVLLFVGVLIYYYSQSKGTGLNIPTIYQNYALVVLISLIGLSIFYHVFSEYIVRLPGWMGFIGKLIFFIPCMLYDAWQYLFQQAKITPASIYVLILLEIFLVVMYFLMPKITDKITGLDNNNGKQLLVNPVLLNKGSQVIATSDNLKIPPTQWQSVNGINKDQYRTNYCISMWVYITPQNGSNAAYTKESEIFSYGYTSNGVQYVKPMVRYYGGAGDGKDSVLERDKFIFYFSQYPPTQQYDTSGNNSYDVSVPTQRWNQFVFNYNRNNVDIFINGRLERSFLMTSSLPQYNDLDQITIGSMNGVQGSICNVSFYNHPLSTQQIIYSYNMLMKNDPPIGLGTNVYTPMNIS
jgi:Concanavalin A-like lectin/glucanases superfamily